MQRGRKKNTRRHELHGNEAISLSASLPCASIWTIDWHTALNFKRSDGGRSSGVYFVQLPNNQLAVVKPDDEATPDYLGYVIARYFGIPHPEMRCVRTSSDEGQLIVSVLARLDKIKPKNQRCVPSISSILTATPCLLVMNFCKGTSLKLIALQGAYGGEAMAAERDRQLAATFGPPGALSDGGRATLHLMGRMMAFDTFIYNYDRLPCGHVFQNAGNTENVMLAHGGGIVAIDSMVSGFDVTQPAAKEQFEKFLVRIWALLTECVDAANTGGPATTATADHLKRVVHHAAAATAGGGGGAAAAEALAAGDAGGAIGVHPGFERVRKLLRDGHGDESDEAYLPGTGYDIGEAGMRELQRGLLSTLPDFVRLSDVALTVLPQLLVAFVGRGHGEERCDPTFLATIADQFRKAAARTPQNRAATTIQKVYRGWAVRLSRRRTAAGMVMGKITKMISGRGLVSHTRQKVEKGGGGDELIARLMADRSSEALRDTCYEALAMQIDGCDRRNSRELDAPMRRRPRSWGRGSGFMLWACCTGRRALDVAEVSHPVPRQGAHADVQFKPMKSHGSDL